MELTPTLKRGLFAFLLFDAAVVIALVFLFILRSERATITDLREIGATVYPEPRVVEEFFLTDENLDVFSKDDLNGHWSLLFFGFTSCPDICPITMAELKKFYEQIEPDDKDDLSIVMVSLDPNRDTPIITGDYVNKFNEDFLGVSGDLTAVAEIASQFFVGYTEPLAPGSSSSHAGHGSSHNAEEPVPADLSSDDYLIEHSGHIAVINPDGEFHAVLRPPHRANDLFTAFSTIRKLSSY